MSFPTNPSNNSTTIVNGITYIYNSTTRAWTRRLAGNTNITYTASAGIVPNYPKIGDQWYNISEDIIYEYITDGTGTYWVDQTSPSISSITSLTTAIQNNQLNPFLLAGM
jgi:hypothetical protein